MARNTKPVPLAEKGWVITMKKISIILLSAVLVFSMAACNGGKEKADNQTEKQTESVKPVSFDELQPGDLIFYSFTSNGRYKNISHVAVYVGNGKVVEALNESLGVVYRDVASTGNIVVIGRP